MTPDAFVQLVASDAGNVASSEYMDLACLMCFDLGQPSTLQLSAYPASLLHSSCPCHLNDVVAYGVFLCFHRACV